MYAAFLENREVARVKDVFLEGVRSGSERCVLVGDDERVCRIDVSAEVPGWRLDEGLLAPRDDADRVVPLGEALLGRVQVEVLDGGAGRGSNRQQDRGRHGRNGREDGFEHASSPYSRFLSDLNRLIAGSFRPDRYRDQSPGSLKVGINRLTSLKRGRTVARAGWL